MARRRSRDLLPPEDVRETLRRRAEKLARTPEIERAQLRTGYLLFRVGAHWYGVSVEWVREILHDYTVATLPCVPEFIKGVTSVRGEILSVTDPGLLMRVRRDENAGASPHAVVVETAVCTTALAVDEIGGIVDVPLTGMEPPLPHAERTQAAYITSTVFLGDALVSVLDVERMVQPIDTRIN